MARARWSKREEVPDVGDVKLRAIKCWWCKARIFIPFRVIDQDGGPVVRADLQEYRDHECREASLTDIPDERLERWQARIDALLMPGAPTIAHGLRAVIQRELDRRLEDVPF